MICIKAEIPEELNSIDDELKAIYHSKDTVCFYVFKSRFEYIKTDSIFAMINCL